MLLKLLILGFVALFIGRLLFAKKLKEVGKAADRTVNLCLIAVAIYIALQMAFVYLT